MFNISLSQQPVLVHDGIPPGKGVGVSQRLFGSFFFFQVFVNSVTRLLEKTFKLCSLCSRLAFTRGHSGENYKFHADENSEGLFSGIFPEAEPIKTIAI